MRERASGCFSSPRDRRANVSAILAHARDRGVSEIMVPRDLMIVESLPLLGTGKLDYPAIQNLVAGAPEPADEDSEPVPA